MPFQIFLTRRKVNKIGFNSLLLQFEENNFNGKADQVFLEKLHKFYRAANFYLIKVFKDPNPCMIRSIILYQMCLKHKIKAKLITGVKKEKSKLQGHSWLEIGGQPFNENKNYLNSFSVIYEV
ncbi:MAG: lasso peptide biosynthesis B2 protein [Actinomycetota bacterium]|nr:lasso peptide biosynthesis B2 protein [Actinomycetota bacterium]